MCVPDPTSPPSSPSSSFGVTDDTVVVEPFPLLHEGTTFHGYLAYPRGATAVPRPLVLCYPNYAGLKSFDVEQAKFLARMGYVGLAVDLYKDTALYPAALRSPPVGAGKDVLTAHIRGAFSSMNDLLRRPVYWRGLQRAWLTAAQRHRTVHGTLAAAIGYCFGGQCALEMVRNGDTIQGAATFHGLLQSDQLLYHPSLGQSRAAFGDGRVPAAARAPDRHTAGCEVLIENGALDEYVPPAAVQLFKEEMDAAAVPWQFHDHSQTHHGFALAPTVWSNHYSEKADRRSTLSLMGLFHDLWPSFPPHHVSHNACGTVLYPDPPLITPVGGHASHPSPAASASSPSSSVVSSSPYAELEATAHDAAAAVGALLRDRDENVAVVEGTSAGLVNAALQGVPRASTFLAGALTIYSARAAKELVPIEVLRKLGRPKDNYADAQVSGEVERGLLYC